MKIEKIDPNQLKITLSCTEMLQINLAATETESENILKNLLHAIENEYSFSIMNHKIILEMIPSAQEGCNLYITKAKRKEITPKASVHILVFSFLNWDTAEYATQTLQTSLLKECQLYRLDGIYYLVLFPESDLLKEQLILRLSDFGEQMQNPKVYEGVLKEYGTLLPCKSKF